MRPISVKFQCFGPYRKEMFVDFEKLEKQGLFLIYGETGAGKTTILDAICYALYAKSSGGIRGDLSTMRCKLAEPSEETIVEFTFAINGDCYRFVRSLRYGRKNLLDSHNCMVLQGEEFVPIFENPKLKNVNQKAEELLGLTHEQFRQVVMLPQGQFEKFLISDSTEKEKILVSLFRAEKWQNIAEEMYSRVAEKDRSLKGEISDIKSRLMDYKCTSLEELECLRQQERQRHLELAEKVKEAEQATEEQKMRYEHLARQKELLEEWERRRKCVEQFEKQKVPMEQMQRKIRRADKADEIKPEYDAFCRAKDAVAEKEEKIAACRERLQICEDRLCKIQEKQQAHERGKEAYEEGVRYLALLEHARLLYASLEERKKEVKDAENRYFMVQKKMEDAKAKYENWHQAWLLKMEVQKENIEKYTIAQKSYLAGISGTLAEGLKEGQPCPVCGSKEHPSLAVSTGEKITEAQLDEYQQCMMKANRDVEQSARFRTEAEQHYQKVLAETSEKQQQMTILQHSYEELMRQKIEKIENTEELEQTIGDLKERIRKYDELTRRFQTILLEAQTDVKSGEDSLREIQEEWQRAKEIEKHAETVWKTVCRGKGTFQEAEFVESLMDPEEKNRWKEEVIRYQTEWKNALHALREQEAKLKDRTMPDMQKEKRLCEQCEETYKALSKEGILQTQSLEKLEKDLYSFSKRKQVYDSEREKVDADLEFVNRLRGRTGISLQRYVLGVMLSSVTAEANRLLKHVHGGRYQLYRTDAISGTGHKGGLELEVLDAQNNEKRSVTTLSGGEKFLVALSLAIGLSTVVQAQGKGVRLGAMFIDEGFGSLDQNSIYDALEVLQGIQKANGLVGIISHVELLQDVIPCKIKVQKGKDGSELLM